MWRGRTCKFALLVSALFLLYGFSLTNAAASANDITISTPLKADLSYQFYEVSSNNRLGISQRCQQDIITIYNSINKFEKWALQYPDSWGRLPYGLVWGHAKSYGGYKECLAATFPKTGVSPGQYCLTNIPIKNYVDKLSNNIGRATYQKQDPSIYELGICVPSACSASEVNMLLEAVLRAQYPTLSNNYTGMVEASRCKVKEPIELRPLDIFALCLLGFIVFCMIASSVYDHIQTKRQAPKNPLFTAFSVLTNAPKVFTVKKVNNPNVINCLSGMRAFSMMWVIYGHGYITYYTLPHINFDNVYPWFQTPYSILLHNATFCVDTFFFLSGFLVLWGAFREMEKSKGKLNLPMMYFHRYVRLTPAVAVVILYILSWYRFSGAGPMWIKIGTQDQLCANTWWANFLYVQNYVFPYGYCMSQSWYLAVDTQLYVLSPIVIIPLWKWGKKALPFVILLTILAIICMFSIFMVNDFTTFRVDDNKYSMRQAKTYYPTHTRLPTYLLGVIFGYMLFTKNRGKQIPLAKPYVLLGWVLAFITMIGCMWGPYWRKLPASEVPAPTIEAAFYEALSRPVWVCAMGWIIWACYNGHGGYINDFLSWDVFTILSRLSYCMYIIHRIVQYVNYGRVQTDTYFDNYDYILRWWGDFGITFTISCFVTLAFEVPILGIESAIFNRKKKETAQSTAPIIEPVKLPVNETTDVKGV